MKLILTCVAAGVIALAAYLWTTAKPTIYGCDATDNVCLEEVAFALLAESVAEEDGFFYDQVELAAYLLVATGEPWGNAAKGKFLEAGFGRHNLIAIHATFHNWLVRPDYPYPTSVIEIEDWVERWHFWNESDDGFLLGLVRSALMNPDRRPALLSAWKNRPQDFMDISSLAAARLYEWTAKNDPDTFLAVPYVRADFRANDASAYSPLLPIAEAYCQSGESDLGRAVLARAKATFEPHYATDMRYEGPHRGIMQDQLSTLLACHDEQAARDFITEVESYLGRRYRRHLEQEFESHEAEQGLRSTIMVSQAIRTAFGHWLNGMGKPDEARAFYETNGDKDFLLRVFPGIPDVVEYANALEPTVVPDDFTYRRPNRLEAKLGSLVSMRPYQRAELMAEMESRWPEPEAVAAARMIVAAHFKDLPVTLAYDPKLGLAGGRNRVFFRLWIARMDKQMGCTQPAGLASEALEWAQGRTLDNAWIIAGVIALNNTPTAESKVEGYACLIP